MKTVIAILVVIVAVVALWVRFGPALPAPTGEQTFCTADAMLCPDGSYVGRTGPNCEFVCPSVGTTTEVSLFYYNESLDQGPGGAQCSTAGLVAVKRTLPADTTLAEVVELLIRGEVSAGEQALGLETEFPLEGLRVVSTEQAGTMVTVTLSDPKNKTSGGACRANVLRLQVEATVKAFSGASEVRFVPAELFQP